MIVGLGEMNVLYLYTRHKFHWNEVDFSIFFTYASVLHLLGRLTFWFVIRKKIVTRF